MICLAQKEIRDVQDLQASHMFDFDVVKPITQIQYIGRIRC